MQTQRQTTDNEEHVPRLQSQLQSTAEQPAVVEQVVGVSSSQAVKPGQTGLPRQPAAATTAQPCVPRYVVPPATGSLAFGSSHWDGKPAEIHAMILKHAGPLTGFLCGRLGDKDSLGQATKRAVWIDAFKTDWQGDLALLPDANLTADNGLLLAHSRSMYDRLCKRFPQYTEIEYEREDARINHYDGSFAVTRFDSRRLLLIPMRHGWFDLVDFTHPITLTRMAVRFGCLDLLKHLDDKYNTLQEWMAKHDPASEFWHHAMDQAASNGHLGVVQYIFGLGVSGCTTSAMDWAAKNGHLDVVQWLHANRTEGCTVWAVNGAAGNGYLNIVQWLHDKRMEGCTTAAMDGSARNGHLHVVKWLHANRTEGCTRRAIVYAAHYGRLDMVQWLHETRGLECTSRTLEIAIRDGHLDIVKYMHSKGVCTSNYAVETAARFCNIEMVRQLLDCGYAVGLGALYRAKKAAVADILLGSLTLDQAHALLIQAEQGNCTKLTIERLESTIKRLQASSKS